MNNVLRLGIIGCGNIVSAGHKPALESMEDVEVVMVGVSMNGVADLESDAVSITINRIFQDEPTNSLGDGDTSPDGPTYDSTQ